MFSFDIKTSFQMQVYDMRSYAFPPNRECQAKLELSQKFNKSYQIDQKNKHHRSMHISTFSTAPSLQQINEPQQLVINNSQRIMQDEIDVEQLLLQNALMVQKMYQNNKLIQRKTRSQQRFNHFDSQNKRSTSLKKCDKLLQKNCCCQSNKKKTFKKRDLHNLFQKKLASQIETRFSKVHKHVDQVYEKIYKECYSLREQMDKTFKKIDQKYDELKQSIDSMKDDVKQLKNYIRDQRRFGRATYDSFEEAKRVRMQRFRHFG